MVVSDKREKRDFACTLDGLRKHSLVLGTGSGCTAWKNLAAVGNKPAQQLNVLVVNKFNFVDSKETNLALGLLKLSIFCWSHC